MDTMRQHRFSKHFYSCFSPLDLTRFIKTLYDVHNLLNIYRHLVPDLRKSLYPLELHKYSYCVVYDVALYEGKSLNNRKCYIRNNFFTRVLTEIVCVLFFDIVHLLRNTLGPPVHKLADAL